MLAYVSVLLPCVRVCVCAHTSLPPLSLHLSPPVPSPPLLWRDRRGGGGGARGEKIGRSGPRRARRAKERRRPQRGLLIHACHKWRRKQERRRPERPQTCIL
jgi:hypothetical protein